MLNFIQQDQFEYAILHVLRQHSAAISVEELMRGMSKYLRIEVEITLDYLVSLKKARILELTNSDTLKIQILTKGLAKHEQLFNELAVLEASKDSIFVSEFQQELLSSYKHRNPHINPEKKFFEDILGYKPVDR